MSSDIEWTDETWNPTVGCSKVSPGCDGCYAIGVAHRAMQPAHEGLTIRRQTGNAKGQCVAAAAVEIINRGRGGKKLPDWWKAS